MYFCSRFVGRMHIYENGRDSAVRWEHSSTTTSTHFKWKQNQNSCLSAQLFPFASPANRYCIDPSLQTSVKIKMGWHGFSHCFQSSPTGIYHWLLCNSHINKCQCPSQEHWDWCKPRPQSYCVLSLRIVELMPTCLPGFHFPFFGGLHSFRTSKQFDLLMWLSRSLGPENLLLKGATLKNTQKICGKSIILTLLQ